MRESCSRRWSRMPRNTNIWCVVVNAPDYDKFPVLFTANLASADLIRRDWRRRTLKCPRDWGGVCWGYCRKYVVFVWKNGLAGYNDPRHMCPCPQMRLSELADTYVLTPTGRVAIVDKAASLEKSASQDISREAHPERGRSRRASASPTPPRGTRNANGDSPLSRRSGK